MRRLETVNGASIDVPDELSDRQYHLLAQAFAWEYHRQDVVLPSPVAHADVVLSCFQSLFPRCHDNSIIATFRQDMMSALYMGTGVYRIHVYPNGVAASGVSIVFHIQRRKPTQTNTVASEIRIIEQTPQ